MNISQQMMLETKQVLCQAQIQSLEILAMDAVELDEFLQNEYMSNPLLDCTLNHDMHSSIEQDIQWFDGGSKSKKYQSEDEDFDARSNLAAPEEDYLKSYFLSQMNFQDFSKKEWELAIYLIGCLEDDGFFRMSIEETAQLAQTTEDMVEKVLAVMRDLEPYGVFAADLSACLLKQLEAEGEEDVWLKLLAEKYLTEISEGKISVISRETGLSTAQIRKYIARIAKLNPKPLSGMGAAEVTYIVPDIIYTLKNGEWEIAINDKGAGNYHVHQQYLSLMQNAKDEELSAYFKHNLERCRFILASVEQRRETMSAIARAVLEKQKEYFSGRGNLCPMTMCALAKELGIHPSTVSRTVRGKYIKSPAGTVLMKKLFCSTVSCEQGEEISANDIKERIKTLISKEDKQKPYSDARLVELLAAEGIRISRRAVAKYRDELWIKSSFDRKLR